MTAYDFKPVFKEFRESAWEAPAARARRDRWRELRDEAHARWARVLALRARNLPYVDGVIDSLLPYADTPENGALGRWRHPSSTLSLDLRAWFAYEGWASADDWPLAAYATVQLIERCLLCPERLTELCERYARGVAGQGIQSSLLSPVLNALVPARYFVVNAASLAALRAFTGVPWSPRLETYSKTNAAVAAFVREHAAAFRALCGEGERPADAFDVFARWYVTQAPEVLAEPWELFETPAEEDADACWKVTPGDRAQRWFKCLADESVAFAWPELGDLSALPVEAFRARVKELAVERDAYRGDGVERLWDLAHAPRGTLLVAARGTSLVLGVGRVNGSYRYVAGEPFPHRLPVDWFDPGERTVSEASWGACIVALDPRWVDQTLDVADSGVHSESATETLIELEPREATPEERAHMIEFASHPPVAALAAAPVPSFESSPEEEPDPTSQRGFSLGGFEGDLAPTLPGSVFSAPTLHLDRDADGELVVTATPRRTPLVVPTTRRPASIPPAPRPTHERSASGPVPTGRTRDESHETELASLSRLADETSFSETELRRWIDAIRRKGQAIVTGPTGTGKTFLARHLARHLGRDGVVEHLQLHGSYRYEDFVESTAGGAHTPGRLVDFIERAIDAGAPSVLVIDDVHRADLARVMGEALHALEYRAQPVRLASGAELTIPRDVYVIGTMNASERAITVADQSLRRRFAFVALPPRYDVLARYLAAHRFDASGLVASLREMNDALGFDAPLGTASFYRPDLLDVLEDVWVHEVEAHLEHHLLSDERVRPFRWAAVRERVLGDSYAALDALKPLAV